MTVTDEPVLIEDTAAWPGVTVLASCLCAEIEVSGLGPVCLCSPLPGADIALDYGTEGMAWVRVMGLWPSATFPSADGIGRGLGRSTCTSPLAVQVELGVARCAPMPGDDGEPPSMVDQFEATRRQLADMAAMRRAVVCCQGKDARYRIDLGPYSPGGPTGGVLWGTWTVWFEEGWGRGNH